MTTASTSMRSGFAVRRLANEFVSVEVVPALGARIMSLKNVRTGREWCWHSEPEPQLLANAYGDSFAEGPNGGCDECFPTIAGCEWEGRALPCHGEVWSVPWTVEPSAPEILSTAVTCRQSPFTLARQISLRENRIQLDYQLRHTGNRPEAYLWAFHPMLAIREEDCLELPESGQSLWVEDCQGGPATFERSERNWPSPFPGFHLDRFELGANSAASIKAFTAPDACSCARIISRANGETLEMSWDAPFLGLWINQGAYRGFRNVAALEPTNGQTDWLTRHDASQVLDPGAERSWSLTITLGNSTHHSPNL